MTNRKRMTLVYGFAVVAVVWAGASLGEDRAAGLKPLAPAIFLGSLAAVLSLRGNGDSSARRNRRTVTPFAAILSVGSAGAVLAATYWLMVKA
jgi:hypothetical protein